MERLKKHIKEGNIRGVYLLFGEERYVISTYVNKLIKLCLSEQEKAMNLEFFSDAKTDIQTIVDAAVTLPFFSDKRVIVMDGLLSKKNAAKEERLLELIQNLPESTVLILIEEDIDKRSKLYKLIQKVGMASEFDFLSDKQLIEYVMKEAARMGKEMDGYTAAHFIHTVGYNLSLIMNELNKLIDYTLNRQKITSADVEAVCIRSIENRIFDLVDSMGRKEREKALTLYNDLVMMREPSQMILAMIIRQFRLNYQTKLLLNKRSSSAEIAAALKIPPFVVSKCIAQSKHFTEERLKQALNDCLELDLKTKTGRLDPVIGVEMIIVQYAS